MLCAQNRWFGFSSPNQPEVNFDWWGGTGPPGTLKGNPECQLTFDNVLLLQRCLKRFLVPADMQRGCQDYDLDSQLSCHLCHTQKRAWRRQWQSKWERQQCPLAVGLGWKAMPGQAPDNRISSAVPTLQFPAGPHERAAVHTAGTHCNGKQVF